MLIETITDHKCELGEGPVWDARHNEICWIDILKGEIHQYAFNNHSYSFFPLHEQVGSIAICKNEDFIIATKSGIGFISRGGGEIQMALNPESSFPNNRFNDGKCDPFGRFWAGTMSLTDEPNAGNLYVFDNNKIEKKISNVSISNGIAWSIDHKTMYYIDTPTFEVVAYNYEKYTGQISNRKIVIKISEKDGYPDGMTIDTEGMLWIAHWDGWQVTRWNPNTGKKLHYIKFPVARVTSCAFGGKNLTDLFITSARTGLTENDLKEQPFAGALFTIRNCGFQGLPAFEFNN